MGGKSFFSNLFGLNKSKNTREVDSSGLIQDKVPGSAGQSELTDIKNQYNELMDSSRDVIFSLSLQGNFISLSNSFELISGYKAEEWINRPLKELIHPDDFERVFERLSDLLKGIKSGPLKLKIKNKYGKYLYGEILASPFKKDGHIAGFLGIARDITQRVEEEEQLLLLKHAVDKAPDAVYWMDPEGNFTYVNERGCTDLGYSRDELLKMNICNVNPRVTAETWVNTVKLIRKQKSFTTQSVHRRKDGSTFPVEISSGYIQYADKEYINGFAKDITTRKDTENALLESEGRLRALASMASEGLMIHDKGIIIEANHAFARMLGYSDPAELIGKNGFEIIQFSPGSRNKLVDHIQQNSTEAYDIDIVSLKGNIVHAETRGMEVLYKGKVARLIFMYDITLRKQAEESLKFQARLQELLMNISSKFINLPLSEVDQAVNSSLKEMGEVFNADRVAIFEYQDEMRMASATNEWMKEGYEPLISYFQNLKLEELKDWEVDLHKHCKPIFIPDSSLLRRGLLYNMLRDNKIASVLAVPIMDVSQCVGFISFYYSKPQVAYSDIENKLLGIFAKILTNIRQRKQSVEELIRAKEKAEESDRLKTSFLHNLSHEIRTPMNSIIGFSAFLSDPELDMDQKDSYIENIQTSCDHLLSIINDVVDLSMIETQIVRMTIDEVNVNKEIKSLYGQFLNRASEKDILLKYEAGLTEKDALINTDKTKLNQILSNLIDNALKFTRSGEIVFGCTRKRTDLEFFVSDTGIGIQSDQFGKIFDPFYQIDGSLTKQFEGLGLGLSICKSYAGLLGGRIWLDSMPGKGSCFYFTLPYIK